MIQEFSNNLKGQIQKQMIEAKKNILHTAQNEKMQLSNHPSKVTNIVQINSPSELLKIVHSNRLSKNAKIVHSNSLSKGVICTNSTFENTPLESVKKDTDLDTEKTALEGLKVEMRFCPITGVSLELEDDKRNYITTKTLKHLKETDPDRYALICSMNLPHTGKHTKYETDIDAHIAKQIRNYYRYRHNVKGKEWAKQLTFDFDTPVVVNE